MASKSRQRKSQAKRPPAGKTAPIPTSTHKPWQIAAVCILLALATVFAYRGVRNNDFLSLDDNDYVSENLHVQQGVTSQSVAWAFTTFQEGNWHPLTWISHMIDWTLYSKIPPVITWPMSASTPPTPSCSSSYSSPSPVSWAVPRWLHSSSHCTLRT